MAAFPPTSRGSFQIPESFTLFNSLLHSDLEDKELRLIGWEDLKQRAPIAPLNIPKIMQEIELEFFRHKKPLIDNVNALFNRLNEKLRPWFDKTQFPEEKLQLTELHLTALEARLQKSYEDRALLNIWHKRLQPLFQDEGAFQDVAPPQGVEAIRAWLNSPANAERIQQVTDLNLSNLGLQALPSEIELFTGVQIIFLHNNALTYLPESIGNLKALTKLYVENNRLSSLPESFGNLTNLRGLNLSHNKFRYLPDSIGNLQALTLLHLSDNQLRSLPDSISHLKALTWLCISGNQLIFLPESFDNLSALTTLDLNGNPLMLVSDKERDKIRDYQTYLSLLEALKKYAPQSPLATLFHAIIFNKPAETIQEAYAQLSPEMKHRIAALVTQHPTYSGSAQGEAASSSSDPSSAQSDLLTDIGLFARSIRKATYDLYYSLDPEQKRSVHFHIWDLAGRPETDDSNWGQHHVFDHVLRFTDALERATQN